MQYPNAFPFTEKTETLLSSLMRPNWFDFSLSDWAIDANARLRLLAEKNCGMPQYLVAENASAKHEKKLRPSLREQLLPFVPWLRKNNFTDNQRRFGLQLASTHLMKVCIEDDDGGYRIFDGRMKGTQSYNKYYKAKIIDKAQGFIKNGDEIVALTITCNINDYGGDRYAAWCEYRQKAARLKKEIQRRYHGGYICVMESTKKGFPHAHIILALPKGSILGYDKMKNKTRIFYGELVKIINKFKPAKIFYLEKICGKNTMHYLTKYIAKYETNSFFDLIKKEGDLSKGERKAVDCLLYTTLAKMRQFTLSQKRHEKGLEPPPLLGDVSIFEPTIKYIQANDERQKSNAASFAPAPTTTLEIGNFRAERGYLIKRCINLPKCCFNDVYALPLSEYKRLFPSGTDRQIEKKLENIVKFRRRGRKCNCCQCIYKHIANFILGKDDFLINFKFWDFDGVCKRWYDDCDNLSDADFMAHFKAGIDLIFSWLKETRLNLDDFYRASLQCGVCFQKSGLAYENWRAAKKEWKKENGRPIEKLWNKSHEQLMAEHEQWKKEVNEKYDAKERLDFGLDEKIF